MKRFLALVLLLAMASPASGMVTTLTARANSMQSNTGAVRYFQLMGAGTALTSDLYAFTWMGAAGTLGDFSFRVTSAPGAGLNSAFVIYKNAGSEITFSISGTATTATPAGTISVAAGDYVYVQCTADAGAALSDVYYTCTFTGTTAGQSLITGGSGAGASSTTVNNYGACMGVAAFSATEVVSQCMPTSGSISHLYCSQNTALSSGSYAITLYVNGSPSALTATLGTGGTTANDVAHSVAISAGDLVEIACVPSFAPQPNATKRIQWGMRWTPTTDGEAVILGGSSNDLSTSASEFNFLNNESAAWATAEANLVIDWPAVELKYLTIQLENSPGASPNSLAFTVRDDGAGTALDVTILDPDTYGRDTTHSVTPAAGSAICIGVIPNDGPAAGNAYWGVVAYIEPEAPPAGTRRVMVIQ